MLSPNSLYQHYKGNIYTIITLAIHTETGEEMVVYMDVASPEKIWTRPLLMWQEKVMVEGREVERFSRININK